MTTARFLRVLVPVIALIAGTLAGGSPAHAMNITVVQTNLNSSGTNNPTVLLNGVAVNDTIVALVLQAATVEPGTPTDNKGDTFSRITGLEANSPTQVGAVSISAFYALRAKGGNTTITLPTIAGSRWLIAELSNISAPTNPVTTHFGGTQFTNHNVQSCVSQKPDPGGPQANCDLATNGSTGNFVFAMVGAWGSPTMTNIDSSRPWTQLGSQPSFGFTFTAETLSLPGDAVVQPSWSVSPAATWCALVLSFPST